jgi:hypothetical protein
MERVFLSIRFRREDQSLVAAASAMNERRTLLVVTSKNLAGKQLAPEIRPRIDESDALVALCTLRSDLAAPQRATAGMPEHLGPSPRFRLCHSPPMKKIRRRRFGRDVNRLRRPRKYSTTPFREMSTSSP